MAPLPEWFNVVRRHQQVVTSDASFSEKAIVLLVVGHILILYTVLCWLGASTVSGKLHPHYEPSSNERWSFKLNMSCDLQQTAAILERLSVSRASSSSSPSLESQAGPSPTMRNTVRAPPP